MPFSVEALQSRSRKEANSRSQRNRESKSKADQPITAGTAEAAEGITDTVSNSNVVNEIWPKTDTQQPKPINHSLHDDVPVDVDAFVYDQPTEDDLVEVGFVSRIASQTQQPSTVETVRAKPSASLPINIPESSKHVEKRIRKERYYI